VPLFRLGASRGFALLGSLARVFLGSLGGLLTVLVGEVVAILVGSGVVVRVAVAGVAAGLVAGFVGGTRRGGRRSCGLARRQWDSANDFVGQLGIRVHNDLHRHVEIVALLLLCHRAPGEQEQQQECRKHDARADDHCPGLL
jgi:hypothetical protein